MAWEISPTTLPIQPSAVVAVVDGTHFFGLGIVAPPGVIMSSVLGESAHHHVFVVYAGVARISAINNVQRQVHRVVRLFMKKRFADVRR